MGEEDEAIGQRYEALIMDTSRALEAVRVAISDATPTVSVELDSPESLVVAGIWTRCSDAFKAVCLLCEDLYSEEAMMVGRGILSDSILLEYFRREPGTVRERTVGWFRQALLYEKGLWQEGLSVGAVGAQGKLREIDLELQELKQATAEKAVSKIPDEKTMAREIGREKDYWVYKLCSNFVHTTRQGIVRMVTPSSSSPDGWVFDNETPDPVNLVFVGETFSRAVLNAAISAFQLLGWRVERLEDSLERLEADFRPLHAEARNIELEIFGRRENRWLL